MPEPTDPHPKVVDLMEALQQSVDEARAARKAHRQAHQPPDEAEVEDEGYPAAYPSRAAHAPSPLRQRRQRLHRPSARPLPGEPGRAVRGVQRRHDPHPAR